MQLDQTHVVIRLRTISEIGDLTVIMLRHYPMALLVGFGLGALPWALADLTLLAWIPFNESQYGLDDEQAFAQIFRYSMWMAILVILQTPLAGIMTTIYLGAAVFEKRPTWSKVWQDTRKQGWRAFWTLGVVRLAVPVLLLQIIRWEQPFSIFFDVMIPLGLGIWIMLVRGMRPFLPEIVLLEQCPIRGKSEKSITVGRRTSILHRPFSSELSGRFILISAVLAAFVFSVGYTLIFARGIAVGRWNVMEPFVLLVIYPFSLWLVAGASVFVRILNYLDARIRLEGWDVELSVRAEAMRQFGEETLPNTTAAPPAATSQSTGVEESIVAQQSVGGVS